MDIQESESKSEEDSNSTIEMPSLKQRLSNCWKRVVKEFREMGNDDLAARTVRRVKFTHVAIMHRLNHPDS